MNPITQSYNGCSYLASGQLRCPTDVPPTLGPSMNDPTAMNRVEIEKFTAASGQPGWVNKDVKDAAWQDSISHGFPVPATEWQSKGNEKSGRLQGLNNVNLSSPNCLYSAEGKVVCRATSAN